MRPLLRAGLFARAVLFTAAVHGALFMLLVYGFSWLTHTQRGGSEPIAAFAVSARDIAGYAEAQAEKQREQKETARAAKQLGESLIEQREEQRQLAEQEEQRIAEEAGRRVEEKKQKQLATQRKAEEAKRRAEKEKQKQLADKRKAEEAERAEREHRAEAARRRAETGKKAEDALNALVGRIAAKVERNWRRPQASRTGLRATIRVRVARDGRVVSAKVTRGSGDPFFDQSAERAVQKASPLPFPRNPQYYEFINTFDFKFHPDIL